MIKQARAALTLTAGILLSACGGGGGTSAPTGGTAAVPAPTYSISGRVQKGPFSIGSQVVANELNGALAANGRTYSTQTASDLGVFTFPSTIGSELVELVADGFYMDELTGQLSASRILLRAIADLKVDSAPTVNVLTSLQAQRLRALVAQGSSLATADTQSRNEVLRAFGIDPTRVNSLTGLYSMRIDGSGDADAVLTAISAILSKMAANAAAANGTSQPSELSNFISTIAAQLASSGSISSPDIIQARDAAKTQMDLAAVRANIQTYYANRGVTMVAPKFEEWVDKDGSGVLPRRLVPVTGLSFSDVTRVEPRQQVTSNQVVVSGAGAGVDVPVSATAGTTIIKNGTPTSSAFTTAKDGDTISLRTTAGAFGKSVEATIAVGSSSAVWKVTTKPLIVTFFQGSPNSCSSTQGGPSSNYKFLAIPFRTDQVDFVTNAAVISKYVAVGLLTNGPGLGPLVPTRLQIQTDSSGAPSGTLVADVLATNEGYGLSPYPDITFPPPPIPPPPPPLLDRLGNTYVPNRIYIQGHFGASGVSLNQNTIYWLVAAYSAVTMTDIERCGPAEPTAYGRTKISSDAVSWTDANVGFLPKVIFFE